MYSSLHHVPYGQLWTREDIRRRNEEIRRAGLHWEVVESLPVTEEIRTRTGAYEEQIENYRQSVENLAAEGIRTIVYNFMPVLDWIRTDLAYKLPDGSECLSFNPVKLAAFDIYVLRRPNAEKDYCPDKLARAKAFFDALSDDELVKFEKSIMDVFPGVKMGLTLVRLRRMLARYDDIDAAKLRENYKLFLEAVVPTAERVGARLAVHPDDPPYSVLGLPRIVSTERDLTAIMDMVPSPANGICFCTGSLSARADNDLPGMVRRLGERIHCVHLRSVQRNPDGSFYEANHMEGSANLPTVTRELLKLNSTRDSEHRLSLRPDHGHRILDDLLKPANANPGYDCLGCMKGLAELRGLQIGILYEQESVQPAAVSH